MDKIRDIVQRNSVTASKEQNVDDRDMTGRVKQQNQMFQCHFVSTRVCTGTPLWLHPRSGAGEWERSFHFICFSLFIIL